MDFSVTSQSPHVLALLPADQVPVLLLLLRAEVEVVRLNEIELLDLLHGIKDFYLALLAQQFPEIAYIVARLLLVRVLLSQDGNHERALALVNNLHEELNKLGVAEHVQDAVQQLALHLF